MTNEEVRPGVFVIMAPPPPVGRYVINSYMSFTFPTKPNWWHRTWTRIFFGWKWVDYGT
jgi:hypothetical protein